jgi:hypothetical protein
MTLWNHLDDGPSHNGHLLGPFESLRGDEASRPLVVFW